MTLLEEIGYGLDALVLFRQLRCDPVLTALSRLCHQKSDETAENIRAYSDMTASLYAKTDDLTEYIEQLVLSSENDYVQRIGAEESVPELLTDCLYTELKLLGKVAQLTSTVLQAQLHLPISLPGWNTHAVDLSGSYAKRLKEVHRHGYGIYANYHMFTLDDSGAVISVCNPGPIRLCNMVGYQRERQIVIENTKALLRGRYASNVLLSGDAGTGKSATIKAIANDYQKEGLRLIELNKEQLRFIPKLMNRLCKNPLKFILFIDDLTFSENDPNFGTLKAILEGSTTARVKNTVIYATSNRRHLIKETFDDGRDKHHGDTVQERISLSARFGITITFTRPEKKLYLEIVHTLAKEAGLTLSEAELDARAEQFALQKIGRSARTARQFVDQMMNC